MLGSTIEGLEPPAYQLSLGFSFNSRIIRRFQYPTIPSYAVSGSTAKGSFFSWVEETSACQIKGAHFRRNHCALSAGISNLQTTLQGSICTSYKLWAEVAVTCIHTGVIIGDCIRLFVKALYRTSSQTSRTAISWLRPGIPTPSHFKH